MLHTKMKFDVDTLLVHMKKA